MFYCPADLPEDILGARHGDTFLFDDDLGTHFEFRLEDCDGTQC